jgi:hypothetical protein
MIFESYNGQQQQPPLLLQKLNPALAAIGAKINPSGLHQGRLVEACVIQSFDAHAINGKTVVPTRKRFLALLSKLCKPAPRPISITRKAKWRAADTVLEPEHRLVTRLLCSLPNQAAYRIRIAPRITVARLICATELLTILRLNGRSPFLRFGGRPVGAPRATRLLEREGESNI